MHSLYFDSTLLLNLITFDSFDAINYKETRIKRGVNAYQNISTISGSPWHGIFITMLSTLTTHKPPLKINSSTLGRCFDIACMNYLDDLQIDYGSQLLPLASQ